MTSHTPPPWELDAGRMIKTSSGDFYLSYKTEKATGAPAFPNFCELDANARLIATSPELLQSLCDLELILSGKPYDLSEQKLLHIARATIAKAKGEQPK